MPAALVLLIDAVVVVVFAAIGRRSHAEGDAISGILITAWPFLVGVAIGWATTMAWRRRIPRSVVDAIPVWVAAVVAGMLLRHAVGKGTAPSFVVVATVFLGLFLLGWRSVRSWLSRHGLS